MMNGRRVSFYRVTNMNDENEVSAEPPRAPHQSHEASQACLVATTALVQPSGNLSIYTLPKPSNGTVYRIQ